MSDEWRPIETAPKDGTRVLIYVAGLMCEAWFFRDRRKEKTRISKRKHLGDCWISCIDTFQVEVELSDGFEDHGIVTHWMPLPAPPKSEDTGE